VAGVDVRYSTATCCRRSVERGTSAAVFAVCRVSSGSTRSRPASSELDSSTAATTITGQLPATASQALTRCADRAQTSAKAAALLCPLVSENYHISYQAVSRIMLREVEK